MKVSEITTAHIKQHIRVDSEEDDLYITTLLESTKSYIMNYTGITEEQLNEHEELTPLVLMMVCELYDNRSYTISSSNVNLIFDSILNMHSKNLI